MIKAIFIYLGSIALVLSSNYPFYFIVDPNYHLNFREVVI